jgi:mRNA interferase MazF
MSGSGSPDSVRRGDVFLVDLSPTGGGEIRKARPCVIVSPDELNEHLRTFIIAPLTTGADPYPFRIACRFRGKAGHIVLDQIRTVDRIRLTRKLGRVTPATLAGALSVLSEMFAP